MADLHISSEAESDLDDIWLYVAEENQTPTLLGEQITHLKPLFMHLS
jgi:hypothetical protein